MPGNIYILKHADDDAAIVSFRNDGMIEMFDTINNILLPYGVHDEESMQKWWNNRAVPMSQRGIDEELEKAGYMNTNNAMLKNLALNLNDNYWVCPVDVQIKWGTVNLYENPFKEGLVPVWDGKSIGSPGSARFCPASSLTGEMEKHWTRINNDTYLIKIGNSDEEYTGPFRSVNEVVASLINKEQDNSIPFVNYKITQITKDDEKRYCCMSKNYTDINTESIRMYDVLSILPGDEQKFTRKNIIKACEMVGISVKETRRYLDYQTELGFLISDVDKHSNNISILRDARTLETIGMAPIYDNGNSMFWIDNAPVAYKQLPHLEVNTFCRNELKLLGQIKNKGILDTEKLPDSSEIYNLYKKYDCNTEMVFKSLRVYEAKISILKDFQNGMSIEDVRDRLLKNEERFSISAAETKIKSTQKDRLKSIGFYVEPGERTKKTLNEERDSTNKSGMNKQK